MIGKVLFVLLLVAVAVAEEKAAKPETEKEKELKVSLRCLMMMLAQDALHARPHAHVRGCVYALHSGFSELLVCGAWCGLRRWPRDRAAYAVAHHACHARPRLPL